MIKVGDKVKFLNEVGGGVVTKIISKNMVDVENDDGFEIPTLIAELIKVGGDNESHEVEEQVEPEEVEEQVEPEEVIEFGQQLKPKQQKSFLIRKGKDEPVFYLAFVPENQKKPVEGGFTTYFVNDSNFSVVFNFSHVNGETFFSKGAGIVEPNSNFMLEKLYEADLNDIPDFVFQMVYYKDVATELFQPVNKKIKINPVKFYKESSYSKSEFFDETVLLVPVSENKLKVELDKLNDADFVSVKKQKQVVLNPVKKLKKVQSVDLAEVDLHIQELIDDTKGLSNKEILDIQMDHFRSELDLAITNKVKKIVFIHGLGQGTLKAEIVKELKAKYKKYYHQDASFKEYGYGATMVILSKS